MKNSSPSIDTSNGARQKVHAKSSVGCAMFPLFLITFLLACLLSKAAYYASPTGTGNGSLTAPFGLQMALSSTVIKAGDTLFLRGGTYKGLFVSSLNGTEAKPIIIKTYQNERVIIDGALTGQTYKNKSALTVNGSYTWVMGIEVTNSDPERTITVSGSNPIERRGGGIDVFGTGVKIINCIIYDVGQGLSWWTPAVNSELYGNVVFNNGWYAPDRFHGHGIYTQNNTGTKTASNNIVFNNFSYGIHVYGSDQAQLKNYTLDGNVLFNGHNLIGGGAPLDNVQVTGNKLYSDKLQLGYESRFNTGLTLTGNYLPMGVSLYWWNNVSIKNNWIFNTNKYSCALNVLFNGVPDYSTFSFDGNNYYWSNPGPGYPAFLPLCWKNTLTDQEGIVPLTGNITNMPMKNSTEFVLTGKKIFVSKNKYDESRFTITIYNWDKSDTVEVDIPDAKDGEVYGLRNVQDYFNYFPAVVSKNGKIKVPMKGWSVAKPLGYASEIAPSTFPEFGCFILVNKSDNSLEPKDTVVITPPPPVDTIVAPFKIEWTNIQTLYDSSTQQLRKGSHTIIVKKIVNRKSTFDSIPIFVTGDTTTFAINYLPTANAGRDTTWQLGKTATIKGTGYDPDGTITAFKWSKIKGPTAGKISYSTRATTTLTGLVKGEYTYQLKVTDNNGGAGLDTVKIKVE